MDMKEHTPITQYVESWISPIPTNGVTMPPNKNPVAPTSADAQPIMARPSVIASVVAEVNTMPTQKSMMNIKISYAQNPKPRQ